MKIFPRNELNFSPKSTNITNNRILNWIEICVYPFKKKVITNFEIASQLLLSPRKVSDPHSSERNRSEFPFFLNRSPFPLDVLRLTQFLGFVSNQARPRYPKPIERSFAPIPPERRPPPSHAWKSRVFSRVSDSTRGVIAGECLHITEHNR